MRDFLTRFAKAAMSQDWLRLRILELDGTPAAAYLAWRIGPRYAVYQSGFDPAFAEQSAGMVLLNDTIRSAIGEQVDDVDLLLGGEPFKWRFAPQPRPVRTVALVGARRPVRLLVAGEAAARRRGRGLAEHPRLEKVARSVARFLRAAAQADQPGQPLKRGLGAAADQASNGVARLAHASPGAGLKAVAARMLTGGSGGDAKLAEAGVHRVGVDLLCTLARVKRG